MRLMFNIGYITYPGIKGVMMTEGEHWVGLGVDENGQKHVIIAQIIEHETGANIHQEEWFSMDNFPSDYYGNIIWALDGELKRRGLI